ncbi:MAG: hypothetical protein AB7P69_14135 [Candidatus Binatia bacterium]
MSDPSITTEDGKRRVTATATLVYEPAHPTKPTEESTRFRMTAPLGPIEAEQALAQYAGTDAPPSCKILLAKLRAILKGDRNFSLTTDPELDYDDAAELQLLLERLNARLE